MNNFMDLDIVNKIDNVLEQAQNNFLSTSFGQIVDKSIDSGIKSIFPDFVENEIIDVKNGLLENGFKETVSKEIDSAISFGKTAIGIVSGNFENINQIKDAVSKGGVINKISSALDFGINIAKDTGLINKTVAEGILNGKNYIMKNFEQGVEDNLKEQVKSIEKINDYCEKWNSAYEKHDIKNMEKNYKNIMKKMDQIVPLESIIKEARKIENTQQMLENNGNDFNFTEEQLELISII